jgi:hypothetical protein
MKLDHSVHQSVHHFPLRFRIKLHREKGKIWRPRMAPLDHGAEPISAWLYYSRRARAVLSVAGTLRQGDKLGDVADWNQFARVIGSAGVTEADTAWLKTGLVDRHSFGMGVTLLAAETTAEQNIHHAKAVPRLGNR